MDVLPQVGRPNVQKGSNKNPISFQGEMTKIPCRGHLPSSNGFPLRFDCEARIAQARKKRKEILHFDPTNARDHKKERIKISLILNS